MLESCPGCEALEQEFDNLPDHARKSRAIKARLVPREIGEAMTRHEGDK